MKKVKVGIIGLGMIARDAHIPGYLQCPEDCEIVAVCDIDKERLKVQGDRCGVDERYRFENYNDLISCPEVEAVDVCLPNYLHYPVSMAVLNAGKPLSVEKPVGMNYKEVKEIDELAKANGLPVFVCFSWRYNKYVRFIKSIIDSGELGELQHIHVKCIKDSGLWEGRRLEWRFEEDKASSGVLCDLGSHMVDITRFMGNEFKSVFADRGINVTRRQRLDSDEFADVTTDDWANITARLENGVCANIILSRTTAGEKNLFEFDIFGTNGRIRLYASKETTIEVCLGKSDLDGNGMHKITPPAKFDAIQSKSFVDLVRGITDEYTSLIREGLGCQAALDAALLSTKLGRYVELDEIIKGL